MCPECGESLIPILSSLRFAACAGERALAQSQNRGFVGYGGRVKAVQSLAALWMFLTLPHAPLPRRCVFDPWVLGANVGSKLCGELSFERPLHFI